jgi:hypothetical protein
MMDCDQSVIVIVIKACKDPEWLRTVCVFRGKLLGY